jgi:serine/threonine protein kinase
VSRRAGDLKPQNILVFGLDPQALPTLKLGDFGLAKAIAGTAVGTVAGTQAYMAPELKVRGPRAKQSVKVDISLGKVGSTHAGVCILHLIDW